MTESGDRGESLIELLISIVIMGLAFSALLGGLATALLGSDVHRKTSDAESVLLAASERVKAAAWVRCATKSDINSIVSTTPRPTGWAAPTVVSVDYWNGTTFVTSPCSATSTGLLAMQLIRLSTTSPDKRGTDALSFVKSYR